MFKLMLSFLNYSEFPVVNEYCKWRELFREPAVTQTLQRDLPKQLQSTSRRQSSLLYEPTQISSAVSSPHLYQRILSHHLEVDGVHTCSWLRDTPTTTGFAFLQTTAAGSFLVLDWQTCQRTGLCHRSPSLFPVWMTAVGFSMSRRCFCGN